MHGRLTLRRSRRAAVRWAGASAPRSARRVASRSRVRKAARGSAEERWAASLRMSGEISSAVGTSARSSLLPRLVGNSARSALGSCGGVHLCARAARRVQRFCQDSRESAPRAASLARTAPVVRIGRVALLPRHTSSAAESGALRLARRPCQSAVRVRIEIRALGMASSP